MPSANELRAEIAAGREALRTAIEGAAAQWDRSLEGDEWSPRKTAEHALSAELHFASEVARATGRNPIEREEFELDSPTDAIEALTRVAAATTAVYARVADGDLEAAVPFMENIGRFSGDVAGAMDLAAYHYNDHARQIGAAS
jgi:hypothetical protein